MSLFYNLAKFLKINIFRINKNQYLLENDIN